MKHLWEIEHDYYGPEGCYYAAPNAELSQRIDSWEDYISEWGSNEVGGMNLIYRWDWKDNKNSEYWDPEEDEFEDELCLFYMLPRKGIPIDLHIRVTKAQEDEIRAFLQQHADYMAGLWAPLTGVAS